MLSDFTFSIAGHSVTVPGIYLLGGIFVVLALLAFAVAAAGSRRARRRMLYATDGLSIQMERVGDVLERLVRQTVALRETLEKTAKPLDRSAQPWNPANPHAPAASPDPGSSRQQFPSETPKKSEEREPVLAGHGPARESEPEQSSWQNNFTRPFRHVSYSMFGR